MRFTNDPVDHATLNIRETEPDFVFFRLWLHPGHRYLSVDEVVLELFGAIFWVRADKLDGQV